MSLVTRSNPKNESGVPEELIREIVLLMAKDEKKIPLMLVSKSFCEWVEPMIYETFEVGPKRLEDFVKSLENRSEDFYRDRVKRLDLAYNLTEDYPSNLPQLQRLLHACSDVTTLKSWIDVYKKLPFNPEVPTFALNGGSFPKLRFLHIDSGHFIEDQNLPNPWWGRNITHLQLLFTSRSRVPSRAVDYEAVPNLTHLSIYLEYDQGYLAGKFLPLPDTLAKVHLLISFNNRYEGGKTFVGTMMLRLKLAFGGDTDSRIVPYIDCLPCAKNCGAVSEVTWMKAEEESGDELFRSLPNW